MRSEPLSYLRRPRVAKVQCERKPHRRFVSLAPRTFYGAGKTKRGARAMVRAVRKAYSFPFGPCGRSMPGVMKPIGSIASASCFNRAAMR